MSEMKELLQVAPGAQSLLEKYEKEINIVTEGMGEVDIDLARKVLLATSLENTNRKIQEYQSLMETTQPADVGVFRKFAINLVAAVVPNLIANDIVSSQPIK